MISFMAGDFFRQSPMLAYPLVALAIFGTVFLLVSAVTVVRGKRHYEEIARLPLYADDEVRDA